MKNHKLNKEFILQFDKDKVTVFDPLNSQLYTLNKTATLILMSVSEGLQVDEIIKKLLQEYKVNYADAEKEVFQTINYLLEEKIIK